MKHIKTIEEFKKINEQLFSNSYSQILNILGVGDEISDVGESPVTGEVYYNISGNVGENIKSIIESMIKHNITNPYTQIAILSVIGKESGYIPRNEIGYGNTNNDRIRKIFGSRVNDLSDSELDDLKKNDVKFFDRVYGSEDPTGNSQKYGNDRPGDGYKYRGRGFNGITFKKGYEKIQKLLDKQGKLEKKVDIVNNPDVLNDVDVAAECAVLYFLESASNPEMYKKYGIKEINGFKDQETALKAMTNANAGWGYDINNDYLASLDKAREKSSQFRINDKGVASLV